MKMVSNKVKLYNARKKLRLDFNKGKISVKEFREQKAYYDKAIEQEKVKSLEKLATTKETVIGTGQETARKDLAQRQTITTSTQQVTGVKDSYGRTYTGKEVGNQFIGVRSVSKQEQNRRQSLKQGFYSVLSVPTQETKTQAQIIGEQTATRGSLGIYSSTPITTDVKYSFKVTPEVPKETGYKKIVSNFESGYQLSKYKLKKSDSSLNKLRFASLAFDYKYAKGIIGGVGDIVTNPVGYTKSVIKLAFFPLYPKSTAEGFKNLGKEIVTNPIETAGRFTGQYLVFKGVEKGVGLANKGYTRLKSEYQFKFKPADKGIYSKLDYDVTNKYLTGSGQRNLFGRNIGDAPKPVGNLNKIGFGIEKNTLKGSTNTILPTGQKLLFKNEIVALNKVSGKFSKVKVTPTKEVFVYNPKLRKYTELSPDYQLITRNPKYTFDVVGSENIFKPKVTTFDVSKQQSLGDFGIKNPLPKSSPIYSPKPKSSFPVNPLPKTNVKPSVKTTQVVKPEGVITTVFPKSQYTYPSYVTETPQTNIPISQVKTNYALGLTSVSSLYRQNTSIKQNQVNVTGTRFKQFKGVLSAQKQNNLSIQSSKIRTDTIQLPKVKQSQFQAQAQSQTQILKQSAVNVQLPKQVQTPIQRNTGFTQTTPILRKLPTARTFNYFKPIKTPKQPKNQLFPSFSIKQPKSYLPSLRASIFNLKGTGIGTGTGIGERLIKKRGRL